MTLTVQGLADARAWLADCTWADMDADGIASLSDACVVRAVARHYAGGLVAFARDGG